MPSNEQIIEAARKRLMPEIIRTYFDSRRELAATHEVFFRDSVHVADYEAEAVTLEPKQEHNHNTCMYCQDQYLKAIEAGRASLKPFDANEIAQVIRANSGKYASEMAEAIAENFAMPERKPWACTAEQSSEIFSILNDRYAAESPEICVRALAYAINTVLSLQPAPEPERCPDCEHTDGQMEQHIMCDHACCHCPNPWHEDRAKVTA